MARLCCVLGARLLDPALSRQLASGSGLGQDSGMRKPPDPHYRHRFPAELISHAVWLYHVFSLSFRDVS